jgi:hypothetical protein
MKNNIINDLSDMEVEGNMMMTKEEETEKKEGTS